MSTDGGPTSSVRRWQRIEELFHRAVELSGTRRARFLADVEPDLRPDLERLLAAEDEAGEFLEDGHPAFMPMSMPERLGPYRLLEPLGEGGAGTVYLAERDDDAYRHRVAIKILRRERVDADLLRRFQYEKQILAGLDHPYIAKILDGGSTDDGLPYFVMEHVEGLPLDEYCRVHGLDVKRRLELFRKVCEAVHHAHQRLVVHRDLKPGNVLVTADGAPKLLDFGIAKLLDPDQMPVDFKTTAQWYRPLTPRYAAPEQIQGKTVTTRTDVYALGVVLYELLTERSPYRIEGRRLQDVERAVMSAQISAPSAAVRSPPEAVDAAEYRPLGLSPKALSRRLAGDLDTILRKALRQEASRRYGSVNELSADLRRHLQGMPVRARPDTWRYRVGKLLRRRPWESLAAALFVIVSVTLVSFLTVQSRRLEAERDAAEQQRLRTEEMFGFVRDLFFQIDPTISGDPKLSAIDLVRNGAEQIPKLEDRYVKTTLEMTFGVVLMENQRLADAGALFKSVADKRRAWNLPGDWERIEALALYGLVMRRQSRYKEAEEVQMEALKLRTDLYGADSAQVLQSYNDLGVIYSHTGRYAQAIDNYEKLLEGRRSGEKASPFEISTALNNLAQVLLKDHRFEEAESAYREALEIRLEVLGSEHVHTVSSYINLAYSLVETGQLAEAEPLLKAGLDGVGRIFGLDHPKALFARLLAVRHARQSGRHAEAESLLDDLRSAFLTPAEGEPPADLGDRMSILRETVRLDLDAGRPMRAEASAREALHLVRQEKGPDPVQAEALDLLATVLSALPNRTAEAISVQEEAVAALERIFADDHPRLEAPSARLAALKAGFGSK